MDEDDWKYSFDKEKGMFRFGLKIKSRLSQIQYMVRVHEKHITFYGITPVSPDHEDEKMMGQMAEFICKANYGLKNGCFEMVIMTEKFAIRAMLTVTESFHHRK